MLPAVRSLNFVILFSRPLESLMGMSILDRNYIIFETSSFSTIIIYVLNSPMFVKNTIRPLITENTPRLGLTEFFSEMTITMHNLKSSDDGRFQSDSYRIMSDLFHQVFFQEQ